MSERTTAELAELLELTEERTEALMQESRDLGLVELVDGRWRLSAHADREFGTALRALDWSIQDSSTFARDSRIEAA